MLAASCGHDETVNSMMAFSESTSALLEEVDEVGQTALFHAAASGHSSTCMALLEQGADTEGCALSSIL